MSSRPKDNSPEAERARAEKAFAKQISLGAQASERERAEAARVAAIDEKTARLRALRLAREAKAATAKKPKR